MTNLEKIAKLGRMVWVVKPDQTRVEEMRSAMTFDKRREFRHAAVEAEGKRHSLFYYGHMIHHIIPLSYGGSNKFANLCLVSKETHDLLHYYIDNMNRPMHPSQRGYVWLPIITKKIFEL